jgi:heme/copper-type cytochrome/quinol oxidase subunit 2
MRQALHWICVLAALGLVSAAASAESHEHGAVSKGRVIQVVSAVVGGKNVFIPSTIVVAAGTVNTLSIFNTTDKPHGFRIAGLGIETVLAPQQETKLELPALEGGAIYEINCQLHPAHRTATLAVLDRD